MLTNYIKLSIRLMARSPFFAFIKVSGLAVGLAMFFILWQYTQSELRSDQQWNDAARIYRLGIIGRWSDDKAKWDETYFATNAPSLVEHISQQYPQITEVTRILSQQNVTGSTEETSMVTDHGSELFFSVQNGMEKRSFKESGLAYGDPNLFTFFGLPLLEGQPESVLSLAGSIVLSERLAVKYFGGSSVIGKTILINDKISLTVTGVFKNLPRNTHLSFDAVVSSERIRNRYHGKRVAVKTPVHYVKIREGINTADLSKKINTEMHPQIKNAMWGTWEHGDADIFLQPLSEMPFQSYVAEYYDAKSSLVLKTLQATAIAILFLAWINYINLASAENLKRMREVATRRIMGARVIELTAQFVLEAFSTNLFALGFALTIIQLVKTAMESVFGFYLLSWTSLLQSTFWILIAVFLIGVLITGLYPAWFVMSRNSNGLFARISRQQVVYNTVFTTLQYSVAIVIAVLAFTIKQQLDFILKQDIGLNKEQVLVVDLPLDQQPDFKFDLNTFIGKVRESMPSLSHNSPGDGPGGMINLIQPGVGAGIGVGGNGGVDENFIPLYQIKMLEGRNFLSDNPADSSSILISDITSGRLGFRTLSDAIGSKVIAGINGKEVQATVVGVYRDYNTEPLLNRGFFQSKGSALTYKDFLFPNELWSVPQKVSFRLTQEEFEESLARIESAYRESFSDPIFNWYFLDDVIDGKYRQYLLVSDQIALFCFLAVGIACLGLLGMMLHKVNNKVKEIGVRKILGAQLHQIAQLLLTTSIKQIFIAAAIGIPAAYFLTQEYLQRFSERLELQWWHLILPVIILIAIMVSTIATIIWRAAKSNPVEALRYE
jgi:putative ABC transport system permease protein